MSRLKRENHQLREELIKACIINREIAPLEADLVKAKMHYDELSAFTDGSIETGIEMLKENNLLKDALGELRAAVCALLDYRQQVGPLNFQLEKADEYMRILRLLIEAKR
jgi:hypothetical protein